MDGSLTPAFHHTHTQTCKADPRITDLEVRYVRDCLNPHKRAGPDGHFAEVLKALSPCTALLALLFKLITAMRWLRQFQKQDLLSLHVVFVKSMNGFS